MSSTHLFLIFGPIFAVAIAIAYLARNDSITTQTVSEARKNPIIRIQNTIGCIFAPIGILLFLNNFFGASMLILGGLAFIFQNKLFGQSSFVQGAEAKFFGAIYLAVGFILAFNT